MALAYLCDPKARSERPVDVTKDQLERAQKWLYDWCDQDLQRTSKLFSLITQLRDWRGPFSNNILWESAIHNDDITAWWRNNYSEYEDLCELVR